MSLWTRVISLGYVFLVFVSSVPSLVIGYVGVVIGSQPVIAGAILLWLMALTVVGLVAGGRS